jgi:hypothetical protein
MSSAKLHCVKNWQKPKKARLSQFAHAPFFGLKKEQLKVLLAKARNLNFLLRRRGNGCANQYKGCFTHSISNIEQIEINPQQQLR